MSNIAKPTGFIIYQGPSMLDGSPIVAIAITATTNKKTGNMVQTYIIRDDMKPTDAVKSGADAAICGDCKHRPANGGACYVTVFQGPLSVYNAFKRGRYGVSLSDTMTEMLGANRMVRLGTYGDPMAVPAAIWEALTRNAAGRTGYTHQWANQEIDADQVARVTRLCMASADTAAEAQTAQQSGKRYFRIRLASESLAPREFVCPASEEAGKRKTCAECGACSGSEKATAGNPVIIVHGAVNKSRAFVAQRMQSGI